MYICPRREPSPVIYRAVIGSAHNSLGHARCSRSTSNLVIASSGLVIGLDRQLRASGERGRAPWQFQRMHSNPHSQIRPADGTCGFQKRPGASARSRRAMGPDSPIKTRAGLVGSAAVWPRTWPWASAGPASRGPASPPARVQAPSFATALRFLFLQRWLLLQLFCKAAAWPTSCVITCTSNEHGTKTSSPSNHISPMFCPVWWQPPFLG